MGLLGLVLDDRSVEVLLAADPPFDEFEALAIDGRGFWLAYSEELLWDSEDVGHWECRSDGPRSIIRIFSSGRGRLTRFWSAILLREFCFDSPPVSVHLRFAVEFDLATVAVEMPLSVEGIFERVFGIRVAVADDGFVTKHSHPYDWS